jgi:anti-sigma factor RsiW
MNCKKCQSALPDLLLDPGSAANTTARAHLATCASCAAELASLEATFALLESWQAPEVSPYFDQKLAVRLREEQQAAPAGWFERLQSRLMFNTGRQFRPAMASALALALLIGGGTFGMTNLPRPSAKTEASATVRDLQILDKNDQALQQMDQLLQDDSPSDQGPSAPPAS